MRDERLEVNLALRDERDRELVVAGLWMGGLGAMDEQEMEGGEGLTP